MGMGVARWRLSADARVLLAFGEIREGRGRGSALRARNRLRSDADGDALQEEQEREKPSDVPQGSVLDAEARTIPLTKQS